MLHHSYLQPGKKPNRPANLIFIVSGILLIAGLLLSSSLSVFAAPPNPNSPNPPAKLDQTAAPVAPAALITTVCGTHTWKDPVDPNYPGLPNVQINLDNALSGSRVRDTFYSELNFDNGGTGYAFCTDVELDLPVNPPQPIRFCLDSTAYADWRLVWLLQNYPPTPTDRIQNAARQAAVWFITDNFSLRRPDATLDDSPVDVAVLSAYDAILASIPTVQPPAPNLVLPTLTVTPATAINLLPGQEVHTMEATLMQGASPMVGVAINLSVDDGGLGTTTLNVANNITDALGKVYFTITNTSGLPYTATVNAESTISIPAGSQFSQEIATTFPLQHLGFGSNVPMVVRGSATKTWQNAPQLISIHKFEDLNLNGVQDAGEPNLANWSFTLTLPDASTQVATTDANGNAFFFNVNQTGAYKVSEILQAGWTNTTPLEVTRTRTSPNDLWTTWAVTFGNVRLGSLQVTKTVNWNTVTPDQNQSFEICILGPSYPTVANCQTINYLGGLLTWTNLIPGSYQVTETDPGTNWVVTITGSPAVVPAGGAGSAAVLNETKIPTAVTLSSFEVKAVHGTQVTLTWTTLTEIDNFYYRIYRSNVPSFGTATLIGTKSAVPNGTMGATYDWTDLNVPGGGHWYYWIADMDSTNVEKSHYGFVDALVLNNRVYLPGIVNSELVR